MESTIDAYVVSIYKSTKLLIKTMPADLNKIEEGDKEQVARLKILSLALGVQTANTDLSLDSLSAEDLLSLYKGFNEMRQTMAQLEEDNLPPMLPSLTYLGAEMANMTLLLAASSTGGHVQGVGHFMVNPSALSEMPNWTNNYNHALLSAMITAKVAPAPTACGVCEAYHIDRKALVPNEYKVLCTWVKAIVYIQNEWNYTSEKMLSEILLDIEAEKINPVNDFSFLSMRPGTSKTVIQQDLKAITLLFRGLCRIAMDTEEKKRVGFGDFRVFLQPTKQAGIDNELIWALELYLNLEAAETEKALAGLQKLQGSKRIGKDEKAVLQQTVVYLEDRDAASAFNYFSDKFFIASLLSSYAMEYFKKSPTYAEL